MQRVQLSAEQIDWVKLKLHGLSLAQLVLQDFAEFKDVFVGDSTFFSASNFGDLNLDYGHGDDIQHRSDAVAPLLESYLSGENKTLLVENWMHRPSDSGLAKFAGNKLICESEVYHRGSINAPPSWELERFLNRGSGTGFLLSKEILMDEISLPELNALYEYVDVFFMDIFDHEAILIFGKRNLTP